MARFNALNTASDKPRQPCPRCKTMAILTSMKYCKPCSNNYNNQRRAKIRAQKTVEEMPAPATKIQPDATECYTLGDHAQNPLYQRWTR